MLARASAFSTNTVDPRYKAGVWKQLHYSHYKYNWCVSNSGIPVTMYTVFMQRLKYVHEI